MEDLSQYGTPAPEQSLPDFSKYGTPDPVSNAQMIVAGNSMANPEQSGQAAKLGRELALPQAAVETDVKSYAQQAQTRRNQQMVADHPKLADWVANNPDAARVAHDDYPGLVKVLDAVNTLVGKVNPANLFFGSLQKTASDQADLGVAALKGLGGSFNKLGATANLVAGGIPVLIDKAFNTDLETQWFRSMVDPLLRNQEAFEIGNNATFSQQIAHTAGSLAGMLSQITLAGTGGAAPEAGATATKILSNGFQHAMKSMLVPALTDAVDIGRRVYQETGDADKALNAAHAQYVATTAMGLVPLSAEGGLGKRLLTGALSGIASGEASRVGMNAVLPQSMQQPYSPENVILSAFTGAGMGAIMGPRTPPAGLREAVQAAADSRLRERDPDSFAKFVKAANDGNVYVDAKTLTEALGQGTRDFTSQIPGLDEQLPEALAVGGDVKIPLGDLIAKLPGSGYEEALLPHLRTSPGGMSEAEAANVPHEIEQMAQEMDRDYAKDEPLRKVFNDIYGQLLAVGKDQVTAAREATLVRERVATRAERLGVDPLELYNENPLLIRRELPSILTDKKDIQLDPMLDKLRTMTEETPLEPDEKQNLGELSNYLDSLGIDLSKSTNAEIKKAMREDAKAREAAGLNQSRLGPVDTNSEAFRKSSDGKIASNPDIRYQGNRGAYIPSRNLIVLMKKADASTFIHEAGHSWLEEMKADAVRPDAPQQIKDDWEAIRQWVGIEGDTVSTESHEKFARGVEQYIREGKAPSNALKDVFTRIRDWLVRLYRSAKDLNVELSPEIRQVFDRMLATDDAIKEARESQGYETPLLDKSQMTEAEYKAYVEQYKAAQEEANDQIRAKVMGELSREQKAWWKEERDRMHEDVAKEVNAQPVYRALEWLKTGKFHDGSEADIPAVKLNRDALVATYGKAFVKRLPVGIVSKEGVHPDLIAEKLGFDTGAELVKAIAEARPRSQLITAEADQRMFEKYGDALNDGTLPDKAMMAVHNDRQADVFNTEMRILKRRGAQGELTPIETIKQIARRVVGDKTVSDLDPNYYARAEAKAGKEAEAAMVGKDMASGTARNLDDAFKAKQRQLLNHYLYREAMAQKEAIADGLDYQKRFDKESVRKNLPGDFVEQIDGLRSQFDFRRVQVPNKKVQQLIDWARGQREFEPAISDWLAENQTPMHYKDMTVSQFNEVINGIRSIEHIANEQKVITMDGKRQALDSVVAYLVKRLQERGDKFSIEELLEPPQKGSDPYLKVLMHQAGTWLRMANIDLKPQEFQRNKYDFQEVMGPFGKYLFERMFDRNYWKNDNLKLISDEFAAKAAELGKDWQKSLYDLVPNKTLLDPDLTEAAGKPVFMKITRGRLLGIMRHLGNESNFEKLTKGWNWTPEQVWSFVHDNATEADWKATQAQWDIFEKYWPEIENMVRRLGGVPPEKIPLRPFQTKFGEMRGGYSPIDYDSLRSKLGKKFGELNLDPTERITEPPIYKATTTFNGSMVNRMEGYTDRVNLDFHSVEGRLRDTIHDLAYREALIDANKILNHPEFRDQFLKTFGREEYNGMKKWLLGIKGMQAGEDNIRGFERALQYARTGVVMTGIAYRLSTVLVHGGSAGLKSLGYLGDGPGAKYFASRVARMAGGNARADIQEAAEKFPEIRTRLMQMDRDYKQGSRSMYEGEDWRAKNDRFGHMMVAWSDALTAIPTAWAAYDRAVTEGIPVEQGGTGQPMNDADAVRYANKVVREAHGTALETNRSLFMQSRGVKGLFGTIYGFMNNTYGQLGDMWDKAFSSGHYVDRPALAARALGTFVIPALWTAYIKHGSPDDNKDPWYWWAAKAMAGELAATVPFVRDAWSLVEYNQGGSVVPVRILEDVVKTGKDIKQEWEGKSSRIIHDSFNAIGELLHIGGLGQAGKTLEYLRDVEKHKEHPQNAAQFVKEAALGPKHH